MSNFKNFSLQGVNEDVQFGKGGGRVIFKDGVFQLVASPTGSDLARLKVADPVDQDDVATLAAVTLAANHVYAKLDATASSLTSATQALSSRVDTLQTEIAATKLDEIVSTDGKVSVVAKEDGVHVTGSLYIGDNTADGLIQSARNVTIAGGDADVAGSVVIRGGQGTTPGHVELHDLLDPVSAQDPVTLVYADKMLAKATAALQTGSIRAVVGSFSETQGDTVVAEVPAGSLLRLKVLILSAFTSGATITVKTSTSILAASSIIDETQTGIYTVELLQDTAADTITVSITTNGDSGKGALAVEYIAV